MAKNYNRLVSRAISSITEEGAYADGGGLYLVVAKGGSRSWQFWQKIDGKRIKTGLGSAREISLADARTKAAALRARVAVGEPARPEQRHDVVRTFGQIAEEVLSQKSFKSASHRRQWEMTLRTYANALWARPVDQITRQDVVEVLMPHWHRVPETAQKLRGRIEKVLARATALDLRQGNNPAAWRDGLKELLEPQDSTKRGHFDAMPRSDVPAFMERLRRHEGLSCQALAFVILTATRSGEVRGANWSEINVAEATWTIPKERMKAKRQHVVPLSRQALDLLVALPHRQGLVFPNNKGEQLSQMALAMALRRVLKPKGVRAERVKAGVTVHGFRSTFRDWCSENTIPRELAELCLAHLIGNAVEQAYARSTVLSRRREVMDAWANFVMPGPSLLAPETET